MIPADIQNIKTALFLAKQHYRKMGLAVEWDSTDATERRFNELTNTRGFNKRIGLKLKGEVQMSTRYISKARYDELLATAENEDQRDEVLRSYEPLEHDTDGALQQVDEHE